MDELNTETQTPQRRKKYNRILNTPMTNKQGRVAVTLLDSKTESEATNRAGLSTTNSHMITNQEAVRGLTTSKLLSKVQAIEEIEAFCRDIMSREAETPLKHSDKVAAARLLADLKGANDTKHTVDVNIGILDLRQATDEELAAELDRIEKSKRGVIDVTPQQSPNSTNS